jgi:hypothetical protein
MHNNTEEDLNVSLFTDNARLGIIYGGELVGHVEPKCEILWVQVNTSK